MSGLELLPWQQPIWASLAEAMAQERLGHALLLCGGQGIGKRSFARVLAAAQWCRAPLPQRLPCGACPDCRQVLSGARPGYQVLRVEEDKSEIAIDQVRKLCESMALASHDGRAAVTVIDPADALNRNGLNALLKTIEEPPPRSHLLLLSERPLGLPATLRSRCQQLRFPVPPREQARAWLAQAAKPGADLDAALAAAHGAPLRALQFLEDQSLELHQAWRGALLDLAASRGEPLKAAAGIGEDHAGAFLGWLYVWLLELLRAQAGTANGGELATLARAVPRAGLDRLITEVQEAPRRLKSNARALLVLESILIHWRGLAARAAST